MRKINIEIGTKSDYRFSNGNTLPLVATPFAMQSFVLQTNGGDEGKNNWFYRPDVNYAEGIRMSNQPSPWLGDYGHIIMLPTSELKYSFWDSHSSLTHKEMQPNYMKVAFARYNSTMEVVPHKYGGKVKVSFNSNKKYLLFRNYNGQMDTLVEDSVLEMCNQDIGNVTYGENFRKFYKIYFDSKIINHHMIENEKISGVLLEFNNEEILYDIITSYISFDQCDIEYNRNKNLTFEELKTQSGNEWENLFRRFDIDENDELFYSNVYRSFLFPHAAHEIDESGETVHFSFYTKRIEKGYMYTDIGFWDVYRTSLPLVSKFISEEYTKIVKSILNIYNESGWLPRWLSPFERGIMPSTLVDPIVAHAITNNIYNESEQKIAIEALLKNGTQKYETSLHGRKLIDKYIELGYIPCDLSNESVSMTLDNAYSDYCIEKALDHLGLDSSEFEKRALNYLNLLDEDSLLFRPKKEDGTFDKTFTPYRWGADFCESDGLTNAFSVFHDIDNLLEKYSPDKLKKRFDEIIESEMKYEIGKYGCEIHEMSEALSLNLGHVAISNQPGFYLPYVLLLAGEEENFYQLMNKCLTKFTLSSEGYPGDEDNGSMAAWYIWARLGEYPFDVMKDSIKFNRF